MAEFGPDPGGSLSFIVILALSAAGMGMQKSFRYHSLASFEEIVKELCASVVPFWQECGYGIERQLVSRVAVNFESLTYIQLFRGQVVLVTSDRCQHFVCVRLAL